MLCAPLCYISLQSTITGIHDRNEQAGTYMINDQDRQRHRQSMHTEREELRLATRHFIRSIFRAGLSVALLPVNRLPREPKQHFQAAGREFTHGVAKLVHELANGLEGMANKTGTSTSFGENSHTNGELE